MRNINHAPRLLVALAITLVGVVGTTWAQQTTPAATSGASQQSSGTNATTEPTQPDQQNQTAGESTPAEAQASAGPSAAVVSVARWLRAIGGRISMGPKIDHTTRISLPKPTDARLGWRVSTPSFAHARLVMPPARAAPANAAPSNESTQTDAVELVAEPATNE
ncbi:hypothetical protein MNBD_PLANCTO03-1782 [hydrothermal vent metagenome]|uniref:Uncharacterized protein n=1 Tax=hydrothermal vent metagenome TaxID=652676 RepID=A0A3B1DYK7_9ZZZZ